MASPTMTRQAAVLHADVPGRTPDHARCACRAFLEFSTGRFGESMERCPAGCFAWRRIQPLYATLPSPQLVRQQAHFTASKAPLRTTAPARLAAVLACIPPAPASVSRQDLLRDLRLSACWADRLLRRLRDAGRVQSMRVGLELHYFQEAS